MSLDSCFCEYSLIKIKPLTSDFKETEYTTFRALDVLMGL